jgi:hypothetical protein
MTRGSISLNINHTERTICTTEWDQETISTTTCVGQNNDEGDDLEVLLSKMEQSGHKLIKLVPHKFEMFTHNTPQKYIGNQHCT